MGNHYKILVIDDDGEDLDIMATVLKERGHSVTGYTSVNEFFNAFRIEVPDVVLVDLIVHEMPGWQIIKKVRNFEFPGLKIVAMSGILESKDTEQMKLAADAFVMKPRSLKAADDLIAVIDGLFENGATDTGKPA